MDLLTQLQPYQPALLVLAVLCLVVLLQAIRLAAMLPGIHPTLVKWAAIAALFTGNIQ